MREDIKRVPATALGAAHCQVGIAEQFGCAQAIFRKYCDADARGDKDLVTGDLIRRAEGVQELLGLSTGHNGEFIATHASRQAAMARQASQSTTHRFQQLIASRVRERAIDLLESIEIDEEQRQFLRHGIQGDVEELDET